MGCNQRIGAQNVLKLQVTNSGYLSVSLSDKGISKKRSVHRLVYDAFVGINDPTHDIVHIDKNRQNSQLENLREMTRIESNGDRTKREKKTAHKIEQWSFDGQELIKVWNTTTEAAEYFNGAYQNIVACCADKQKSAFGFTWKRATKIVNTADFRDLQLDGMLPYRINEEGVVINKHNSIITQREVNGYRSVTLTGKDKKKYGFPIHRLVAAVFNAKPDGLDVVNHLDKNPSNNHKDNLEWTNTRGNTRYSCAKKVKQIDPVTDEVLCIYDTITDAFVALNKTYCGRISKVCQGKQESAYGFNWEYA